MDRAWYWRLGLVLAVTVLSVYQLVPSWFYFRLPPDKRNGPEYEQSVPRWAPNPKKHLNLGLDLQGGIHLVMGVDVDRAVKAKVARRADEISDFLKEKGVAVTSSSADPGGDRIEVKSSDLGKVKSTVLEFYGGELYSPATTSDAVVFAFTDKVKA